MPAQRGGDAVGVAQRDVVTLSDIVHGIQLHHQMMQVLLPGLDQRKAVMARIHVHEIGAERRGDVTADAEAQRVAIEPQQVVLDILHMEHRVPHAQCTVRKPEIA